MALVEHREHDRDRVLRLVGPLPVDQHGRQHVLGDEAAQPRLAPVFGRRHRMGAGAHLFAEAGRQQDEVAMAGMVGEVDALPLRRLAAVPDRPHAGHHPGQRRQADRGHRLQQGERVGAQVKLGHRRAHRNAATSDAAANRAKARRCFISRRRVPAMRWSSERSPAGGGLQPHARQHVVDRGTAGCFVVVAGHQPEQQRVEQDEQEKARVARAPTAATNQAAADSGVACGPAASPMTGVASTQAAISSSGHAACTISPAAKAPALSWKALPLMPEQSRQVWCEGEKRPAAALALSLYY